jgi:hypothetical protein
LRQLLERQPALVLVNGPRLIRRQAIKHC